MAIAVFSGTTEGRIISEAYSAAGILHHVFVATEYGHEVMTDSEYSAVHVGRLSVEDMKLAFEKYGIDRVVDATHPYALEVSENIRKACADTHVRYKRISRECEPLSSSVNDDRKVSETAKTEKYEGAAAYAGAGSDADADKNIINIYSVEDAVSILRGTTGNIFLTTGSKELPAFAADDNIRSRLIVRVLPSENAISICDGCNIPKKHIIAEQGPFSVEENDAVMRRFDIRYLVTKNSGAAGGYPEKIQAAGANGVQTIVIYPDDHDALNTACKNKSTPDLKSNKSAESEFRNSISSQNVNAAYQNNRTECQKVLNITLAGIGMGYDSMTIAAQKAIESADIILGARRMIAGHHGRLDTQPLYRPDDLYSYFNTLIEAVRSANNDTAIINAVILFSGDTGFYSGASKACTALEQLAEVTGDDIAVNIRVQPGISTVSALSALFQEKWDDAAILSAHGLPPEVWCSRLLYTVSHNRKTFLLTNGKKDLMLISELLSDENHHLAGNVRIALAYNAGSPDQKTYLLDAGGLYDLIKRAAEAADTADHADTNASPLLPDGLYSALIINNSPYPAYDTSFAPRFIRDDEFIRSHGIPMTKADVRAEVISRLALTNESVLYDIGSGTGSISVQAAALFPGIRIYAFDEKSEACSLTLENAEKFGLPNITVREGKAPEIFAASSDINSPDDMSSNMNIPAPTHAFIGGTDGNLTEIIDALYNMCPEIRIVMTAVSLNTIAEITNIGNDKRLSEKGIAINDMHISQTASSDYRRMGRYLMPQTNNPVYIADFILRHNV